MSEVHPAAVQSPWAPCLPQCPALLIATVVHNPKVQTSPCFVQRSPRLTGVSHCGKPQILLVMCLVQSHLAFAPLVQPAVEQIFLPGICLPQYPLLYALAAILLNAGNFYAMPTAQPSRLHLGGATIHKARINLCSETSCCCFGVESILCSSSTSALVHNQFLLLPPFPLAQPSSSPSSSSSVSMYPATFLFCLSSFSAAFARKSSCAAPALLPTTGFFFFFSLSCFSSFS